MSKLLENTWQDKRLWNEDQQPFSEVNLVLIYSWMTLHKIKFLPSEIGTPSRW
jgi:hypothetical protein